MAKTKVPRRETLDAFPDRIDARDWWYQPTLAALPDQVVNVDRVPCILDQGSEGACTGFALAGVINLLLRDRGIDRLVSPRMLYDMARRYDEWPGESYEGSSARGAMKGWIRHGVCDGKLWPNQKKQPYFSEAIARDALQTPGGAYYRVMHRHVRDLHAALSEVRAVYLTLMVHPGWDEPGGLTLTYRYTHSGHQRKIDLPVIRRVGQADAGHAVAIVGYTTDGLIIQNSWGESWGWKGFALLPYEDYMLHATDVWVAQLGVPTNIDVWVDEQAPDATAGSRRAVELIPPYVIRPYVIDVGDGGELSDSGEYWTTEADIEHLFLDVIPTRTRTWTTRRVLLYLHGGLNDEAAVARRIVAFRDVLLENEIYPIHVMWETGLMESLKSMLTDSRTGLEDKAGGVADLWDKLRDGIAEAKDRAFERTVSKPGTALWDTMKENARRCSQHPKGSGGMQIVAGKARHALSQVTAEQRSAWELHVVAHSAGSIFAAYALPLLVEAGLKFKTLQLLAPAIRCDLFQDLVVPLFTAGKCPKPSVFVLSDAHELADSVGPYGKSLLYLVSYAFERPRATSVLGIRSQLTPDLLRLLQEEVDGKPGLVVSDDIKDPPDASRSRTHGGFDNDPVTLNSVVERILGGHPKRPFTERDLQY